MGTVQIFSKTTIYFVGKAKGGSTIYEIRTMNSALLFGLNSKSASFRSGKTES
jgi:hypothetical protein